MSQIYKIESGIPLPPKKHKPGLKRNSKGSYNETMKDGYPFSSMQVGDSFVFTEETIVGRARHWGNKLGMRFVSRTGLDNVRRIWRVS